MNVRLTEEQELLRQTLVDFMNRECPKERVRQLDEEGAYPYDLFRTWAESGWLSLPFPESFGGSGRRMTDMVMIGEVIGNRGYDLGIVYSQPVFTGLNLLDVGSPELIQRFIPPLLRGEHRFAVAFSEPSAGSDGAAIETHAEPDGDGFRLNGYKLWCSQGGVKDTYLLLAVRTIRNPSKKQEGISLFLVPNTAPGIEVRKLRTLGRRISGTYEVFLENVPVTKDDLVGRLHFGWEDMLGHHARSRLFLAALYVGHAQTVVDEAREHALTREQFGRPIGQFQAIAHMLADMQTQVEAARWLNYRAASLMDAGLPALREVNMAKLFGSEALQKVAGDGMQIMGGYGYSLEYDMQRHFRDARVVTIAGGTSQIMRQIISRQMGLK